MPTRLIIARHGNTFAPGDIVRRVGITDLPLVASGLQQGRRLGIYLKENNLTPDVIFTSTLKRTQQTAEQAQEALNLSLLPIKLSWCNEIDYGPDENRPEEEVIARIGKTALEAWERESIVPGGWKVDPSQVIKQWRTFVAQLLKDYPNKNCLVITSNGIARFVPYITQDFSAFRAQHPLKIATGAVCLFEPDLSDSFWHCLSWNIRPEKD